MYRSYRLHCPGRPVQAALVLAFLIRVQRLTDPILHPERQNSTEGELDQLKRETTELLSWIGQVPQIPEADIQRAISERADLLQKAGRSGSEVVADARLTEKVWRKRPKGRPPTQRVLAVAALEMRLGNPRLSWTKLAKKICPCGQPEHNFGCRERIRIGVVALRKALKKHKIRLSEQSSSPRPM